MNYADFLRGKAITDTATGLSVVPSLHPDLFDFQHDIVAWALRRGRAAIFADCGLGKTLMQIEWARHVPGDVLILAPLAVAAQTVREGERFGIAVHLARKQADIQPGINIAMAWSYHARSNGRNGNDWKEARAWLQKIIRRPVQSCFDIY